MTWLPPSTDSLPERLRERIRTPRRAALAVCRHVDFVVGPPCERPRASPAAPPPPGTHAGTCAHVPARACELIFVWPLLKQQSTFNDVGLSPALHAVTYWAREAMQAQPDAGAGDSSVPSPTSGPPPYHSMTGESATSISSRPAQPARCMISAKPRRLDAAPTGSPSTRTWRPSPLTGGQTVTERSVIRQASPATTRRASGRSTRCRAGRRVAAGGVQVRPDTHQRCPGRAASSVSRTCSSTSTAR
ncbi:hypothetical protein SAMN02787118_111216 [Streptomyces mirabilis]|uniref:Uncharacterized protein n=1 Tax=Streptomyces mirabilis TaxID=68239 RepID=A0A1I2L6C5_9ACTN|nr:hypothetical protein SAMN02787118_111216 [Streptomyces mirabilis]